MKMLVVIGAMCALAPPVAADSKRKAPAAKTVRVVFPSKRAVRAPVLAGTYGVAGTAKTDSLSYTEVSAERGIVNAVVMTGSHVITCADARAAISNATDVASESMKGLGVAWYVSYSQHKNTRRIRHACLALKSGGCIEVTINEPAAATGWPDLEPIAVAMLAARK